MLLRFVLRRLYSLLDPTWALRQPYVTRAAPTQRLDRAGQAGTKSRCRLVFSTTPRRLVAAQREATHGAVACVDFLRDATRRCESIHWRCQPIVLFQPLVELHRDASSSGPSCYLFLRTARSCVQSDTFFWEREFRRPFLFHPHFTYMYMDMCMQSSPERQRTLCGRGGIARGLWWSIFPSFFHNVVAGALQLIIGRLLLAGEATVGPPGLRRWEAADARDAARQ